MLAMGTLLGVCSQYTLLADLSIIINGPCHFTVSFIVIK